MTSNTSPTKLGSRAAVGSSNKIIWGFTAMALGDADPLLLATREAGGILVFFVQ